MSQPTQNNAFEFSHLAAQVDQFDKPNWFELAPTMEELLRRVGIVKGWIVQKQLKPDEIQTAEKWLKYVEERAELDAVTKQTIQSLRADIARWNLSPEEQARRVREDFERLAKDPAGFDKLVSLYLSEQAKYAPDKRISEFQMMFDRFVFWVGLTYRIDKKRVIIYDQNDVEDSARTASINRIPHVVELIRSSRAFEAINTSGQKSPLAYINAQTQKLKLPKLTADILSDPAKRVRYISDVRNSRLPAEVKAFIIDYVEDPATMDEAYQEMQSPAAQATLDRERARIEANKAVASSGKGVEWTPEAWDKYLRNPEKLVGDMIGGMGVWIAPATIYLILNLFWVSHDSLFMKLLAWATVVGTLKGTGVLNMTADAFKGKWPIADAGRSIKDAWDTSKKEWVVRWLSDKFWDISGWSKEKIAQFSAWAGYSNYYAEYSGPSGKQTLDVVDIPFEYIQSHVKAGTWDARFRGNDTLTMRSNGTDLSDFRRMIEELDAEGVKNYGLAKWREIRANKTLKEVISVAHNKDGVASSAGNAVTGAVAAGATAVAWAASAAAEAVKTGGKKVAEVAGEAADAAGKKLKPVADWGTGTESPEDREARERKEAERAAEWKKGEWTRGSYTQRALSDAAMVKAWNEKKENKDKWLKVEQYLDFINSQSFQYGVTLENAFDFAGPDRRSLAVSPPSNFDTRTFTQVFRKYLFNTMDPLPKGVKETFFNDKKNEPYAKKSLAEFMTK